MSSYCWKKSYRSRSRSGNSFPLLFGGSLYSTSYHALEPRTLTTPHKVQCFRRVEDAWRQNTIPFHSVPRRHVMGLRGKLDGMRTYLQSV